MTDSTVSDPAACADCGARFHVPDPTRSYRCKKCGGAVRAEDTGAASEAEPELAACPQCEEPVPTDAAFCDACGEPLTDEGPRRRGSAKERRGEQAELRRAKKRMETLRTTLMGFAVGSALLAILPGTFWLRSFPAGWAGTLVADILAVLTITLALQAAALFTGMALVKRSPLAAALLSAAAGSVALALNLIGMDWSAEFGMTHVWMGVYALMVFGLWALVPWAAKLKRLRQAHPEWFQRKAGARRGEARDKPARWPVFAAVGTALVGLLVTVLTLTGRTPEGSAKGFVEAWNAQDDAALAGYFEHGEENELYLRITQARTARTGDGPIELEFLEAQFDELRDEHITYLQSAELTLDLRWRKPGPVGGWIVRGYKLR